MEYKCIYNMWVNYCFWYIYEVQGSYRVHNVCLWKGYHFEKIRSTRQGRDINCKPERGVPLYFPPSPLPQSHSNNLWLKEAILI